MFKRNRGEILIRFDVAVIISFIEFFNKNIEIKH